MEAPFAHQRRCLKCNIWVSAKEKFCPECGFQHDKELDIEVNKRIEAGDPRLPIIQVLPTDPMWVKIAKRPIQLFQAILYAIIAFLIYLTTVFAH